MGLANTSFRSANLKATVLLAGAAASLLGIVYMTIGTAYSRPADDAAGEISFQELIRSDLTERPAFVWSSVVSPCFLLATVAVCLLALLGSGIDQRNAVALVTPLAVAIVLITTNWLLSGDPGLIVLAIPFLVYPGIIGARRFRARR